MRFQFSGSNIVVETAAGLYIDTAANFATDHGRGILPLPPGATSMETDGAGRVIFYDAKQNARPATVSESSLWKTFVNGVDVATLLAARTARLAPPPAPPPAARPIISYEEFQNRFTPAELDAVTELIDEINLANGKPKRPALKQALMRGVAKGTVDLADPRTAQFLQALVAAGIVSSERRDAILTP